MYWCYYTYHTTCTGVTIHIIQLVLVLLYISYNLYWCYYTYHTTCTGVTIHIIQLVLVLLYISYNLYWCYYTYHIILGETAPITSCPSGVENIAHDDLPNYYWHCDSPGHPPSLQTCGNQEVYVPRLGACYSNSSEVVTMIKRNEENPKTKAISEVEATGELISIGVLYNKRSSQVYTALNMFKEAALANVRDVDCQSSTFEVRGENGVSQRAYTLGVDASFKLEFLFGLITVSGSAHYLRDEKQNSALARVTMSIKSTNRCKTIPITTESNPDICELAKSSTGPTHVVTSITTGLRSFFLYERQTSLTEYTSELSGSMSFAIKSIPGLAAGGDGKIGANGYYKAEMEKVNVKFYGDAIIEKYPAEYEDAYLSLDEILEKARTSEVPIKYQLTPIEYFCDVKATQIRELNKMVEDSASKALQELQETLKDINALLRRPPALRFGTVKAQLINLRAKVMSLETNTKTKLLQIYPLIRSGIKSESDLTNIVADYEKSRYSRNKLTALLYYLTRQTNTLDLITSLPTAENGIKVSYSGAANDNDCVFNTKYSYVFTLHTLPKGDVISTYDSSGDVPTDKWFDDTHRVTVVGGLLEDLVSFSTYNQDSDKCFLIR